MENDLYEEEEEEKRTRKKLKCETEIEPAGLLERVKKWEMRWSEVEKWLVSLGIGFPSAELGQLLVSHLCFQNQQDNYQPSLWKFLHHALSSRRLLSPPHLLSLLSSKLIPHRRSHPHAYTLYLHLLSRYALHLHPLPQHPSQSLFITESVDAALQLSRSYALPITELQQAFVLFFFTIVVALIDAAFQDWGLPFDSLDVPITQLSRISDHHDADVHTASTNNKHYDLLRKTNSSLAIEVLAKLTESRKATLLLRLVYLNMSEQFNGLLQRLWFFEANKLTSPNAKSASQLFETLSANIRRVTAFEYRLSKHHLLQTLINIQPCAPSSHHASISAPSACWIPFDIFMESSMDGKQLPIKSAISLLTETIRTLQVLNRASWQDTFLALWLAALRLVQRERNPLEGPIPHLESRLSVLLTIVPLAIANVLEDDASFCSPSLHRAASSEYTKTGQISRKHGLISSLQVLGHFSGLLCPPASVTAAANAAAVKAASFISNSTISADSLSGGNHGDTSVNAGGNMRHLIVEACIARNLIDTSAYFWSSYVSASVISLSEVPAVPMSPWLKFMEGAPLNSSLVNLLLKAPAPSVVEIKKLYHIALNGSVEEKPTAAKLLCSASLSRGWNIQEHVVHHVVKLLSPPIPSSHDGQNSHLIDYMPMLSAILFGISSVDTVHVLSLHGVIPEVAASLMPICETFGSLMPTSSNKSSAGDEPSIYRVFSAAFLFLLRLWKFYRPAIEQFMTGGGALAGELSVEYLLLLHNSQIASHNSSSQDEINSDLGQHDYASDKPMYIDFYPKLRAWYCQNKSCIASPLSGLPTGNPVHQVANKILNMICWKMSKSKPLTGNSSMPSSTVEDPCQGPTLPAWEVLEAIPFVLEAILTACAHGRLSSRDLTTGLRDLIDFLPASLGTIISYFSAEVSRGIWKPVPMNGTDWPSPAAILPSVESEINEILEAVGVDSTSCYPVQPHPMLPLPMAALVSLTITFNLNKGIDYIQAVVGPALENCASGCPWPSIAIICSLWAQKVRRWHRFIVVSCARSVFRRNKVAVAQLLRSCFSSFLGSPNYSTSMLTNQSSVSGLLGSIISRHSVYPSIAPGFLFLRSCRTIHDVQQVNDVIVGLVAEHAKESAMRWAGTDSSRLKSSQASLSFVAAKVREVATLGASLLCASGGMHLVQELYRETIPTWLITSREEKLGKMSSVSRIMEGYAIAYLLILSGSLVWGVEARSPAWAWSKRAGIVGSHMDFLGRVLEGNILLGCHPATWRAYVSCVVGLIVSASPAWVGEVKLETLRKLAKGLRGWHECELALSLLERGGVPAIGSVAELMNGIN